MATAFIIAIISRLQERLHDALAVISSLAIFALSVFACMTIGNAPSGVMAYKLGSLMPPAGIALIIDGFSVFMLVTVNLVAFLIALYASGYMRQYTDKWKFYCLFFLMLSGINGVLLASDIFNLYVFLEIAAIAAYFLVAFGTEAEELEAAFKYAIMGAVASCFILLGIAFLYGHTSTLNMADMASVLAMSGPSRVVQLVSVLFIMGFGLKAALVPFHAWLAYAHSSAPAPVSAMLSGVLIKVLGIYALARIFYNVFGMSIVVSQILIVLAVLSMIVGAILAFGQSDIKRLLAYSTVSQIGYVALGLGIGTPLAIFGAFFHLFNHSIFKSLLFMDAGSIEMLKGTRDMNKISGVIADAPVTGYSSLISALSICGLPPLGGFWSKAIIIFACIQAHRPALGLIAALVSVLTLAYYFRALTPVLFGAGSGIKARPTPAMNVAMAVMAILVIASALTLLPSVRELIFNGAVNVVTDGMAYAAAITGAVK